MLYTINTDKNNFVLSISHTDNDNIDIDIEAIELEYLNAYELAGNKLIMNQDRKNEIEQERQQKAKETEIESLKRSLSETDYIVDEAFENVLTLDNPVTFISDFIKILVQYNSKYATVIANRKIWRDRIEELSK